MDPSLLLTSASIRAQTSLVRSKFSDVGAGRGAGTYLAMNQSFEDTVSRAEKCIDELGDLESGDRRGRALSRELEQLLSDIGDHAGYATRYRDDVGRKDLPAGLLHLIDKTFLDLYGAPHFPILHFEEGTYAVSAVGGRPLVVNLPITDPSNVLLAPVLVHEIAHPLWNEVGRALSERIRSDFGVEIGRLGELYPLMGEEEALREVRLLQWAEEFFCDAVATLVTGPAYAMAMASEIVGRYWNETGGHPPHALRIRACMALLEANGWKQFMDKELPQISEWLEAVGQSAYLPPSEFLVDAIEVLFDVLHELARERVGVPFGAIDSGPSVLARREHFLCDILPVELESGASHEWETVLAGWLSIANSRPGDIAMIAHAPRNEHVNSLVAKTVELRRIVELWSAE